jgi:hypothetical protein
VKNEQGELIQRYSRDVASEVGDEYVSRVASARMTFEHAFTAPCDARSVETVVVDLEGNRSAVKVLPVPPCAGGGLQMSDLAFARDIVPVTAASEEHGDAFQFAGKRVIPSLSRTVSADKQLMLFFCAYPDLANSRPVKLTFAYLLDGKQINHDRPQLLPRPDESGRIPVVFKISTVPGSYRLVATITQGRASVSKTIDFTVSGSPKQLRSS